MKMTAIMTGYHAPLFKKVAETERDLDFILYNAQSLEQDPDKMGEFLQSMGESDVVFLYRSNELFWEILDKKIKSIGTNIPVICLGYDPSCWSNSTVDLKILAACEQYLQNGGEKNIRNLFHFIENQVLKRDVPYLPPEKIPWEGLYHPDTTTTFHSIEDYLAWYSSRSKDASWVGILISRSGWVANKTVIEDTLIRALEDMDLNVIPVFCNSVRDKNLGKRGMTEIISDYFIHDKTPRVDAVVKLIPYLIGIGENDDPIDKSAIDSGAMLLRRLNVPVFQPIIAHYQSVEQWREGIGLTNDVSLSVAMPEFDGVIEPVFIGSSRHGETSEDSKVAVPERCKKVAARIKNWVSLSRKPVHERKVSFILTNNPCKNADADIGGAAHLDSLESVARILREMEKAGYSVTPPASGKELIQVMNEKKAKSEFRWTTPEDIIAHGGVLMQMDIDTFMPYFSTLPKRVQDRITETWGESPGKSMVYDNKILITGLNFGNATVHVQPKRGCYGSRCDGEVCKVLHDPTCPPPQQYLATYFWIEQIFGADVLIHVGTHGNLEFLPGKGVGLSEECFPDISVGTIPFLYIYNADNPPEGTIAKRRGLATLVDHMQTVLIQGGLYEGLEEVDNLLGQYETAKQEPARAHAFRHLLIEALLNSNLDKDIHLTDEMVLEEIVSRSHEVLSKIRNTKIPSGMHIFGELPEGDKRLDFIASIIQFDTGESSPRRTIARIMGLNLVDLLKNQDKISDVHQTSNGILLEHIETTTREFIRSVLETPEVPYHEIFGRSVTSSDCIELDQIRDRIIRLNKKIEDSHEIESLLNGFSGGYIPAGPSGLISRGRDDVMPTGRNFYSMDPHRVPTKTSWVVGQRLADNILNKYLREEGKYPENIGFYWMCSDVMSSDGEMYAQLLALLGAEPVWGASGQVKSFTIIPLGKLGRPRIDITVRTTGLMRDNFPNCYELLDEAVQAVAALEEPPEQNFVRKHALQNMAENGGVWRESTMRVFSAKPGTYFNGVELAVYASAWKEEADLADIFVAFNGYAYGKDILGKPAQEQFASSLATVSVTFNKVHSDEYDLLSCCGYFGSHGGITAAARHYSGTEAKAYYGDTREPENIEVRDLSDELRRVVRTKLLNPKWIEGMKEHGYKGAADIMGRVTHVYGWEASTQEVDDWIFDDIANTFVNDAEMREFFEHNNPYALEEIARRLLEADQRGLWDADEQTLEALKNNYLQIESWMEDPVTEGDYQGGNIDVLTQDDVAAWRDSMKGLMDKVREKHPLTTGNTGKTVQ
jgi:cobaltochelatase CobN